MVCIQEHSELRA